MSKNGSQTPPSCWGAKQKRKHVLLWGKVWEKKKVVAAGGGVQPGRGTSTKGGGISASGSRSEKNCVGITLSGGSKTFQKNGEKWLGVGKIERNTSATQILSLNRNMKRSLWWEGGMMARKVTPWFWGGNQKGRPQIGRLLKRIGQGKDDFERGKAKGTPKLRAKGGV